MTRAEIDRICKTLSSACHAHLDALDLLLQSADVPVLEHAEILEELANDILWRSEEVSSRRSASEEITA